MKGYCQTVVGCKKVLDGTGWAISLLPCTSRDNLELPIQPIPTHEQLMRLGDHDGTNENSIGLFTFSHGSDWNQQGGVSL